MHELVLSLASSSPRRKIAAFILEQLAKTSNIAPTTTSSTVSCFFRPLTPLIIGLPTLYKLFFADALKKATGLLSSDKKEIQRIIEKCSTWHAGPHHPPLRLHTILLKSFDHLTAEEAKSIANAFIQSQNRFREAGKTIIIAGLSFVNPLLGMAAEVASHAMANMAELPSNDDGHDYQEMIRTRY